MCQTIYPNITNITSAQITALSCFNTISGLANIIINLYLVYGILKLELVKKTSYKFILFLCISDICVGIFPQQTLTALLLSKTGVNRCLLEITTQAFQAAFCQFSVIMILIITVDRYLHMNYLTRYNRYMTTKRALLLLLMNLLTCVVLVILSVTASIYHFYFTMHTVVLILNSLIFTIILVGYTKTYFSLRNRVNDIQFGKYNLPAMSASAFIITSKSLPTTETLQSAKRKQKHHLNFAKPMIFVLLTLAVCYLPYFTIVTLVTYVRFRQRQFVDYKNTRTILLFWSLQLVYLNSTLNGIIVIISCKVLRQLAWKRLRKEETSTAGKTQSKRTFVTCTQTPKLPQRRITRSMSF